MQLQHNKIQIHTVTHAVVWFQSNNLISVQQKTYSINIQPCEECDVLCRAVGGSRQVNRATLTLSNDSILKPSSTAQIYSDANSFFRTTKSCLWPLLSSHSYCCLVPNSCVVDTADRHMAVVWKLEMKTCRCSLYESWVCTYTLLQAATVSCIEKCCCPLVSNLRITPYLFSDLLS